MLDTTQLAISMEAGILIHAAILNNHNDYIKSMDNPFAKLSIEDLVAFIDSRQTEEEVIQITRCITPLQRRQLALYRSRVEDEVVEEVIEDALEESNSESDPAFEITEQEANAVEQEDILEQAGGDLVDIDTVTDEELLGTADDTSEEDEDFDAESEDDTVAQEDEVVSLQEPDIDEEDEGDYDEDETEHSEEVNDEFHFDEPDIDDEGEFDDMEDEPEYKGTQDEVAFEMSDDEDEEPEDDEYESEDEGEG